MLFLPCLMHLVFLPKNLRVNQQNYLGLLIDHSDLLMEACHADLLMQDEAPRHRAEFVTDALDFMSIYYLKHWPVNSPYPNPTENLWGKLKSRLQNYDVSFIMKLKDTIQQLGEPMPQTYLQTLALSLPNNLKHVRNAKGYPKTTRKKIIVPSHFYCTKFRSRLVKTLSCTYEPRLLYKVNYKETWIFWEFSSEQFLLWDRLNIYITLRGIFSCL